MYKEILQIALDIHCDIYTFYFYAIDLYTLYKIHCITNKKKNNFFILLLFLIV